MDRVLEDARRVAIGAQVLDDGGHAVVRIKPLGAGGGGVGCGEGGGGEGVGSDGGEGGAGGMNVALTPSIESKAVR